MSKYKIKRYSYDKAKELRVIIKPSTNPNKKIDVYDYNGNKICSIGSIKYKNNDYPTYIKTNGIQYANKRRMLYKLRHEKDRHVKDTAGYYADKILW